MANKTNLKTLLAISVFLLVVVFGDAGQMQAAVIADAVAEFSGIQGQNNWYYGYYDGDGSVPYSSADFEELPHYDGSWYIDRALYWTDVSADRCHPHGLNHNWDPYAPAEHWAVRRWVSEVSGTITITGNLADLHDVAGTDGVVGHIFIDGTDVFTHVINNGDITGVDYNVSATVNVGSVVDFAVAPRSNDWADSTTFTATIALEPATARATIYVDATKNGDGTSWSNAYKYLQDALADAQASPDDIWVAEGTYKPDENTANPGGTGSRTATFQFINGVALYGGYPSGGGTRDPATNVTILSGDLDGNDDGFTNNDENSYCVVTANVTAILDGFTITAGNAWEKGGGITIYGASPTIQSCVIRGNTADGDMEWAGGGILISGGSPRISNTIITGNLGVAGAGGVRVGDFSFTMINSLVVGNSGRWAIHGNDASMTLINVTIADHGSWGGLQLYNSQATIANSILWEKFGSDITTVNGGSYTVTYSNIEDGVLSGVGNITQDPLFVDADNADPDMRDYHLQPGSPCVDAGDNDAVPSGVTTDLDGKWRFFDDPYTTDTGNGTAPIVDMGAYERQQTINYDLVKSGYVDWKDLEAFTDEWLNDCNLANNWCDGADFDQSGDVGFGDFGLWAEYWLSDFLGDLDNLLWADVMSQEWQQPAKLDDFIGVHPRYLLTAAKVTDLKSKIASAGVHQDIWLNVVKPKADWYLTESPYGGHNEDVMRPSGRAIPWLALAYLMTDNTTYSDKAISWMLTVCGYSNWDNNYSLGAGEGLVGVSIGYDWLYDDLTEPNRVLIRDKLIYQAGEMAADPVHKERWLANHNHVEHNGLAAAGFVLYDDGNAPDANDWIRQADLVFQTAFVAGSSDGSSTEGHQYWGYSMESILCYTEAARDLMGKDYYDSKWIEGATDFIIFCTLPDFNTIPGEPGYANCVMSFGDSHRDYRGHGPTHILCRLASEYNNGFAQWLAEEMIDRGVGVTQEFDYRAWANLLWYDETVTPAALSGLGTFKHFDDIGWVTSRSGWDEDAVMVSFKCGPFHGHKVQPYYEKQVDENWPETKDPNMEDLYGFKYHKIVGGHGQPDVGSFQVYAHGKWLATEPGYSNRTASRMKHTKDHCTILAGFGDPNERGQVGEWTEELNSSWFDVIAAIDAKATSSIIKAESCAEYDYIIGDAENIYRDPNLSKFLRHFIYIKPDVIVIADELEDASPPSADYFQWRLRAKHARPDFEDNVNIVVVQDPNYYRIENNNDSDVVVMDVHFIYPELSNFSTSIETVTEYYGNESKFLVADFDSTSGGDMLATVLHPRRDEDPACSITSSSYVSSVLYLTIQIGAETTNVELDLANQEANIE